MPVWHERTKKLVADGRLSVLGITQEQHPDRCRLFCQWHGIEWPVLWDPFNLTGARAVPNFTLIDAHGVVRIRCARPEQLDAFLATAYPAAEDEWRPAKGPRDRVVQALGNEPYDDMWLALSRVLWDRSADPSPLIEALGGGEVAARQFRLGVALRIRHDSAFGKEGDFQRALDAWRGALAARPNQYIWRRRIQQYGPRPDKPYPFYDWIDRARRDIEARGEKPVALPVPLSATERNAWNEAAAGEEEPDPKGLVPRSGTDPIVAVETAVAWDTSGQTRTGRLHVRVRPLLRERAVWTTDGTPIVVWIDAPDSWTVAPQRLEAAVPLGTDDDTGSMVPVLFECDVTAPKDVAKPPSLRGYAIAPVCRARDGACVVIREDFDVERVVPQAKAR